MCCIVLEQDFNIKETLGYDHDDVGKLKRMHFALMAEMYVAIVGVARPLAAKNSKKLSV